MCSIWILLWQKKENQPSANTCFMAKQDLHLKLFTILKAKFIDILIWQVHRWIYQRRLK